MFRYTNFKRKIVDIFLPMFWVLKKPSHSDGSFEFPQNIFMVRNKRNHFL